MLIKFLAVLCLLVVCFTWSVCKYSHFWLYEVSSLPGVLGAHIDGKIFGKFSKVKYGIKTQRVSEFLYIGFNFIPEIPALAMAPGGLQTAASNSSSGAERTEVP